MSMDIAATGYQGMTDRFKTDRKKMENKGCFRAETLEDLRDTTGKSFKTADLEKLMEKYDPEAFAQYSKFARGTDGARTQRGLTFLSNWMDDVKKDFKSKATLSGSPNNISKENEAKLSDKALQFLDQLKKQYGSYDFFVGNSADDLKSLVKSGTREFTVIFSNAELEHMANDEKYASQKVQQLERAVRMSEEINRQYGFKSAFGKNTEDAFLTKTGIIFKDDGTTTFFAELEKSSAKQREYIEKAREEKRTAKKETEKKAEKEIQSYSKGSADAKKTTVWADSINELFEKIAATDWASVKSETIPERGGKFDFIV